MDIKLGDIIIQRILDEQDIQLLYTERIYIVLSFDETKKIITAVTSVDWICGYQRDISLDYDSLLEDGCSIDVLDYEDVNQSRIYKKLDSSTFETIGYEYSWFDKSKEVTVCVPYVHLAFNHKLRSYIITSYDEDFAAAMKLYPNGNETYIFGKRYSNFIVAPFDIEHNIHILGNGISKK